MSANSAPLRAPSNGPLAVAICTCNNIRTIRRSLDGVADLAGRVVVVDSGSTDGTAEACREFGAEVIPRPWQGPVSQKQFAIDQCRDSRWVLLLDSDESLEEDLRSSIREVVTRDDQRFAGWELNRKVWFMDGWLHHTFQPERRLRLVRGGAARIVGIGPDGLGGHDRMAVPGQVGLLLGTCRHDSWDGLADMLRRYISLGQRAGEFQPKGGGVSDILFRPSLAMFKQLVMRRGFLDGRRGLIAAAAVGIGTMMKHLFIAQRRMSGAPLRSSSGEAPAELRLLPQGQSVRQQG